jgi:hypothetical protein
MTTVCLNRISTAVSEYHVHDSFVVFAEQALVNPRPRRVFRRMMSRAEMTAETMHFHGV